MREIRLAGSYLGEIRKGNEIWENDYGNYIWHACVDCGKERWVKQRQPNPRCASCSAKLKPKRLGINHKNWKGGRHRQGNGYIMVWVADDDFFAPMRNNKRCVLEHRLVVAKHLGRCLQPWEIVHHKNHIKDDNRIENLQLVTDDRHKQITILENEIKHLKQRVTLLEADNVLLREQVCVKSY